MDDLTPKLQEALGHVDAEWTRDRADQTWRGLRVKRKRRAVMRAGAAACAVLLAVAGAYWWQHRDRGAAKTTPEIAKHEPTVTPLPPEPAPEVTPLVVLDDGTVVTAAEADALVEVLADNTDRAEVRVVRGKTAFAVPDDTPERELVVAAGGVRIDVYSTQFSVAHSDGRTDVWADNGVLRIEWEGKTQEVRAGEHAQFPPPDAIDMPPIDFNAVDPVTRSRTPRERVDVLMRAADRARDAQSPAQAVKPLRQVVSEFSRDSRAPLAAFTLGRVLLDDLDQPREAARAFRKARALAPRGPLAEDALAREAEAWSRAGDTGKARERAQQYLDAYPDGHRVRAVRKYLE
jgi:transmembrane sensor